MGYVSSFFRLRAAEKLSAFYEERRARLNLLFWGAHTKIISVYSPSTMSTRKRKSTKGGDDPMAAAK